MPVAVLEKLVFGIPVLLLFAAGRVEGVVLTFGLVDLMLAVLFVAAYRVTAGSASPGLK